MAFLFYFCYSYQLADSKTFLLFIFDRPTPPKWLMNNPPSRESTEHGLSIVIRPSTEESIQQLDERHVKHQADYDMLQRMWDIPDAWSWPWPGKLWGWRGPVQRGGDPVIHLYIRNCHQVPAQSNFRRQSKTTKTFPPTQETQSYSIIITFQYG